MVKSAAAALLLIALRAMKESNMLKVLHIALTVAHCQHLSLIETSNKLFLKSVTLWHSDWQSLTVLLTQIWNFKPAQKVAVFTRKPTQFLVFFQKCRKIIFVVICLKMLIYPKNFGKKLSSKCSLSVGFLVKTATFWAGSYWRTNCSLMKLNESQLN